MTTQACSGRAPSPATAASSSSRETNSYERPISSSWAASPSTVTGKIARGFADGSAET